MKKIINLLCHFGFQFKKSGDISEFFSDGNADKSLCVIHDSCLDWHVPLIKENKYTEAYSTNGFPWSCERVEENSLKNWAKYNISMRVMDYDHLLALVGFLQSGCVDAIFLDGETYFFPDVLVSKFSVAHENSEELHPDISDFISGLERNPESALLHNFVGKIYLANDDIEKAAHYFVNACEKVSEFAEPYSNMGALMWNSNEKEKGFDLFCQALIRNPFDTTMQDNFIQSGIDLEKFETMLGCIDKAAEYFPDYTGLKYLRVVLLERMGRVDECRTILAEIMRDHPEDTRAQEHMSELQGG